MAALLLKAIEADVSCPSHIFAVTRELAYKPLELGAAAPRRK